MIEKSGLEISQDEADRIKTSLRKEVSQWLSLLASFNYEYIAEYRERIEGAKNLKAFKRDKNSNTVKEIARLYVIKNHRDIEA